MTKIMDEVRSLIDQHNRVMGKIHETQCDDYRTQIYLLKEMNEGLRKLILKMHKESEEKLAKATQDPHNIFDRYMPAIGPAATSYWDGLMSNPEAAIKTNEGS